MSRLATFASSRRRGAFRPSAAAADITIIEDLRSFARDLGVHGCSGLTKEELVEMLRQRYLLEQIRTGGSH
jgi:hypothetical protein